MQVGTSRSIPRFRGRRLSLHLTRARRSSADIALSSTSPPWAPLSLVRAGVLPVAAVPRASPFGSVVTGSLGLPSGLPFAAFATGRLPRYEPVVLPLLAEWRGKCSLPDKEFRYLRHCCYLSQCNSALGVARSFAFRLALRVATEIGPSHCSRHAARLVSGIWPLRILSRTLRSGMRFCFPPIFMG